MLAAAGAPTDHLWQPLAPWPENGLVFDWEGRLAEEMHRIIKSLTQFVELEAVIVSSFVPANISRNVCLSLQKLAPEVTITPTSILSAPKAVGAASLPFMSRFMVESGV
jgi:hypothetical protein